jgi:phosphohistidine swiveling domain-containing protein
MGIMVKHFKELTPEQQAQAGGKGGMLARMFQEGYPVPEGFVVLPPAFQDEKLKVQAWNEVRTFMETIRKKDPGVRFAVRSSALSEDSAQASFAGEFETVLNVKTGREVHEAIDRVFKSRQSQRVQAYSRAQGLDLSGQIAVVIQQMVPSEISGVLFTADPITGSYANMIGSYVLGFGEQLVSGEANGIPFKLARPGGKYDGPQEFRPCAPKLHQLAARLEKKLGCPQDIEWTVAEGKLYLLQARPVTSLNFGNLDTYEINESLSADGLWFNTNVGEAIPDVISPLSWSIVRDVDDLISVVPGYHTWSGNICGRIYSNLSQRLSAPATLNKDWDARRSMKVLLGDTFGRIPEGIETPVYPFTRGELMSAIMPKVARLLLNGVKAIRSMPRFLKDTPEWCRSMTKRIEQAGTLEELRQLWELELKPTYFKAWWGLMAGASGMLALGSLQKKLTELVGAEDATTLSSNLRGEAELASLGPALGIARVMRGELSREAYLQQYGHRSPHEFELYSPDPSEAEAWVESLIKQFQNTETDAQGLLEKQRAKYEAAYKRFVVRYPQKAKWLEKSTARAGKGMRSKEAARSEFVRVFRVIRRLALKAGELAGIGDGVFFLYRPELEGLLAGKAVAVEKIPARRVNFERYKTLPPFPSIIRGRFDPFEWVKLPNKRMDYYDSNSPADAASDSETLQGFAGAPGRVEGVVRILANPEDGETLRQGEILVTTTTNVGWTPLFPKAAAIITDVGAPLSHAGIVARELGIPAVVGCGNATGRLKNGDRVMVDGGQGTVYILK